MRLASKGQMTMPKESPGAKLVRELVEYGNQMRRKGKLNNLTTEEIMEMTRGKDWRSKDWRSKGSD